MTREECPSAFHIMNFVKDLTTYLLRREKKNLYETIHPQLRHGMYSTLKTTIPIPFWKRMDKIPEI